jgi:hypothetical protein
MHSERAEAIAHVARIIREDKGEGDLAGGLEERANHNVYLPATPSCRPSMKTTTEEAL